MKVDLSKEFWVIIRLGPNGGLGGVGPSMPHYEQEEAEKEAKRLAAKHHAQFAVFKYIGVAEIADPPVKYSMPAIFSNNSSIFEDEDTI